MSDPIGTTSDPNAPVSPEPALADAPVDAIAQPPTPRGIRKVIAEHVAILRDDRLTWFASLAAAIALTVSRYHASAGEYHRLSNPEIDRTGGLFAHWARTLLHSERLAAALAHVTGPIADYVYWFLGSVLLFFALPVLAAALTPGVRVRELGAGVGDWRYGLKAVGLLYLVMLPFVVGASFTPAFANHYPMASGANQNWASFWTYEACYASYFIGWEFIYRGLLCVALYPRLGAGVILLHTIPFAVMHGGKPEAEAYGSIVAGIALGVVAVRARSAWYGALLHALIAFTMDVLALAQTHRWPA